MLSVEQEADLVQTVTAFCRGGFPFKRKRLRQLAYEMATRNKRTGFSPTKGIAGKGWLRYFLKRHRELKVKNTKNLSIARAMGANPKSVAAFFDMYKKGLQDNGLLYQPNRIWNIDECGVGDVPFDGEQVVGVTNEPASQTVSGEKATNTTVLTFISAGGMHVPPMLIFKGKRVAQQWREAAPSGYTIRSSEKGYITGKAFREYGEVFVRYLKERGLLSKTKKVMLLLDLHSAHLFNLAFMEYMLANNVEVYCFPPHCTHVLQPLDDTPYAAFKSAYNKALLEMNFRKAGVKINRYEFFRVFIPAFTSSMSPALIQKGYANTGIYPVNPRTKKLVKLLPSSVFDKCE